VRFSWNRVVSECRLEHVRAPTCIQIPPYSSWTAPMHQYTPKQSSTPTYNHQLLRMNVIAFDTCWAIKTFIKWHQVGSIYSTSKMMHGPLNIRKNMKCLSFWNFFSRICERQCHWNGYFVFTPYHYNISRYTSKHRLWRFRTSWNLYMKTSLFFKKTKGTFLEVLKWLHLHKQIGC